MLMSKEISLILRLKIVFTSTYKLQRNLLSLTQSSTVGPTDTKTLNPKLICPVFDVFFPWLPEKIRKPLRFGVRHGEVY